MEDHLSYCEFVEVATSNSWMNDIESENYDCEDLGNNSLNSDELLIDLVKNYPHLYDKKHADFKDAMKKENSWEEISKILHLSVADIKSRWTRLREKFAREKKAIEDDYRSGKEAPSRQIWPLYKSLEFLKPFVVARKTLSNLTKSGVVKSGSEPSQDIPSAKEQITVGSSSQGVKENISKNLSTNITGDPKTGKESIDQMPRPRPLKRKYDNVDNCIMNLSAAVTSHLSAQQGKNSTVEQYADRSVKSEDTEEAFGILVTNELKKLPDVEKTNKKKQILKVLYDI